MFGHGGVIGVGPWELRRGRLVREHGGAAVRVDFDIEFVPELAKVGVATAGRDAESRGLPDGFGARLPFRVRESDHEARLSRGASTL